jgi:hypothetical protein
MWDLICSVEENKKNYNGIVCSFIERFGYLIVLQQVTNTHVMFRVVSKNIYNFFPLIYFEIF